MQGGEWPLSRQLKSLQQVGGIATDDLETLNQALIRSSVSGRSDPLPALILGIVAAFSAPRLEHRLRRASSFRPGCLWRQPKIAQFWASLEAWRGRKHVCVEALSGFEGHFS